MLLINIWKERTTFATLATAVDCVCACVCLFVYWFTYKKVYLENFLYHLIFFYSLELTIFVTRHNYF